MLVLILAFAIAVSDQITKYLVRLHFAAGESHPVIAGFFDLTYVRNTGAAWGMMGGQNTWLSLLSIVMLVVMVIFRRSFISDTWEHRTALGLMVGGIIGNLADRIRLGWVVDFLDFHIKGHHWPAFNIADAGICIGVGIYIISALWISTHPLSEARLNGSQAGNGSADAAR